MFGGYSYRGDDDNGSLKGTMGGRRGGYRNVENRYRKTELRVQLLPLALRTSAVVC